jgi:hypothetical protein
MQNIRRRLGATSNKLVEKIFQDSKNDSVIEAVKKE